MLSLSINFFILTARICLSVNGLPGTKSSPAICNFSVLVVTEPPAGFAAAGVVDGAVADVVFAASAFGVAVAAAAFSVPLPLPSLPSDSFFLPLFWRSEISLIFALYSGDSSFFAMAINFCAASSIAAASPADSALPNASQCFNASSTSSFKPDALNPFSYPVIT